MRLGACIGRYLSGLYVGNQFANLPGCDVVFEAGHVFTSDLDPPGKARVGDPLPVRKSEPPIKVFEAWSNLLSCGLRKMTRGAMLVKEIFARNGLLNL